MRTCAVEVQLSVFALFSFFHLLPSLLSGAQTTANWQVHEEPHEESPGQQDEG